MNKDAVRLRSVIGQCVKHTQRLNYAYSQLAFLLPFTVENVDRLKDEEISHLDQYIFRFSKLQDTLGQQLFPAVLARLGEEIHNKSFLDIFNRLEQLNIIEDFSLWQELRIVRNELAHEYNEDEHELAEKLNKFLKCREPLEKYFHDILEFIENKRFDAV